MTDQEIRKPLDKISKSSGISAGWLALIIAFVVIIADQTLKIWIKTNFYIGEDYEIFRWFHIKFIENNGMAFGLELWNKLVLTFGRIIAVALFVWFIIKVKDIKGIRKGFIVAVALIAAGAAGNIFDCVFYGKIFNNPMPPQVAEIFPADGGYAGWFEGKVVDMLYFPFFDFYWPEWMPVVGGSYYEFFCLYIQYCRFLHLHRCCIVDIILFEGCICCFQCDRWRFGENRI